MHACLLDADHHPIRRLIDTIATSNVTVASITLSDMAVTPIEESRSTVSQLTPNSCDAEQTGLGVRDQAFRLSRLLEQSKDGVTSKFRLWVDQAEAIAMRAVERVAGKKTANPR